ncbi:MAG TPA: hypothetical protein VF173_24810 [Thermoanaerobaculia bacterium]|nr:hypothetical protein [Thermoanaerobaculia bacterium]
MKNVARIAAVLFLLFAGLASKRASAIIFFCGDICNSQQSCGRNCVDDSTGNPSNCLNWDCCIGHTWNC